MKRTKKETITESSRTTRVKLYKSGKQWVQCLLTRVGLLKIATHSAPHKVQLDESEANLDSKSATLLKGVLAAGAMIGGRHGCFNRSVGGHDHGGPNDGHE
ncbi:hypothetical protein IU404_00543 [Limosilactobacillus reuteri]|nr:hypothetical protein IU404_00543 [Limosilactobacillus reuteri]UFK67928.1 hypothetical protein IVR12_00953 [Limosilactobacillus reuteri]